MKKQPKHSCNTCRFYIQKQGFKACIDAEEEPTYIPKNCYFWRKATKGES